MKTPLEMRWYASLYRVKVGPNGNLVNDVSNTNVQSSPGESRMKRAEERRLDGDWVMMEMEIGGGMKRIGA